jgi:hypothetical protein
MSPCHRAMQPHRYCRQAMSGTAMQNETKAPRAMP